MEADYLILGQGIAGTLLSYALIQAGKSVLVIDQPQHNSSSRIASAVINPISGKQLRQSNNFELFKPAALQVYQSLEQLLGVPLLTPSQLWLMHNNAAERDIFAEQMELGHPYLKADDEATTLMPYFNLSSFGSGQVSPCWVIQGNTLLDHWRDYLAQNNALLETHFDWDKLVLADDYVQYGDIKAHKLICCEGVKGRENPYFSSLPYNRNKGEALILKIPGLPQDAMYHFGLRLVPWGNDDLFWFGSSHEWTFADDQPSQSWYTQAIEVLDATLKLPYTVVEHLAAERPSVAGQIPFAGIHPHYPALAIFNGLGTRGYSSGPFFAQQLAQQLLHPQHSIPIADIRRFYKRWPEASTSSAT